MKRLTFGDIGRQDSEFHSERYLIHHLFQDAQYFLDVAKEQEELNVLMSRRYLRAAVISAYTALEAWVNTVFEILARVGDLELHERAFVEERRIELSGQGYLELQGKRFHSLDDKLKFLHWRIHGVGISDEQAAWMAFLEAEKLRNKLVHPSEAKISYSAQTVVAAQTCAAAVFKVAEMLGWSTPEPDDPT